MAASSSYGLGTGVGGTNSMTVAIVVLVVVGMIAVVAWGLTLVCAVPSRLDGARTEVD
jgi:hypothetical protein